MLKWIQYAWSACTLFYSVFLWETEEAHWFNSHRWAQPAASGHVGLRRDARPDTGNKEIHVCCLVTSFTRIHWLNQTINRLVQRTYPGVDGHYGPTLASSWKNNHTIKSTMTFTRRHVSCQKSLHSSSSHGESDSCWILLNSTEYCHLVSCSSHLESASISSQEVSLPKKRQTLSPSVTVPRAPTHIKFLQCTRVCCFCCATRTRTHARTVPNNRLQTAPHHVDTHTSW